MVSSLSNIINKTVPGVTVNGTSGNDTIINSGSTVKIVASSGNDSIYNGGSYDNYVTIDAGDGDDTIYGNPNATIGNVYQYGKDDGSDMIYNWSAKDSLSITGGASWSSLTSYSNVIVSVAGSGQITLGGAKGKTLNIYPAQTPDPTPIVTVTPQEIIKKFMKTLDTTGNSGVPAISEAVRVATNGYFKDIYAAQNQIRNDCQTYIMTYGMANGYKKFLLDKCGIVLDNDDTGAITGYDAGGSTYQRTPLSIVYESSNTPNNFTGNSFKLENATHTLVQLASFSPDGVVNTSSYTTTGIITTSRLLSTSCILVSLTVRAIPTEALPLTQPQRLHEWQNLRCRDKS